MNDIRYTMLEPPEYGVPTAVAEGLYMLRLPLPFALDHVNVWLIEYDQGWTIVDTGLGNQACLDVWENIFGSFLGSKPVKQIILTHYHPDHVGLSGDLAERTQAGVYMSRTEWLTANMLYHDNSGQLGTKMLELFCSHGLPQQCFEQMQFFKTSYRDRCSRLPGGYNRIKHGDEIDIGGSLWQCRLGLGHSPEHMALYNRQRKILISGDHILPKITPNIPMPVQEVSANPIAAYLESLNTYKDIDNEVLVLPSHRLPFIGLQNRIEQIVDHHHQRLSQLLSACSKPITAFDVLPALFNRELDSNQMTFAMLEALAHMVYLKRAGKLQLSQRDGIYVWQSL